MAASSWLLICGIVFGAGAEPEAVAGDLAQLQGTWVVTENGGGPFRIVLDIDGHKVHARIASRAAGAIEVEGELRIDSTSQPRRIDWVGFRMGDGSTLPDVAAIYRLEEGVLTLRNGGFNDTRPEAFEPGDGPLAAVYTFQRGASGAVTSHP